MNFEPQFYDPSDYGPFFDNPESLAHLGVMGSWVRQTEAEDRDVIARTVAGIIAAVIEGGLIMSDTQVGNVAARVLYEEGGFHRRHQC